LACASRSRGIGTRTSRKMVRRGGGGLAPISIRSARNFRKLFVTSRARRTIWLTRLRHLNSKQCHLSHQAAIYLRASIRFATAQSPNSDRGSSGTQARSISAPSSIFSVPTLEASAQRGVHRNGTPATDSKRQSNRQDHSNEYINASVAKWRRTTATSAPRHVAEMERG